MKLGFLIVPTVIGNGPAAAAFVAGDRVELSEDIGPSLFVSGLGQQGPQHPGGLGGVVQGLQSGLQQPSVEDYLIYAGLPRHAQGLGVDLGGPAVLAELEQAMGLVLQGAA